ncbi:uncharacterized protein LOC117188586 [Drosophila miranda]|uniref:uncharacterized protein LOC108162899 n=1 Tax=Drosophila miranda TaxID=7229 RepID=UPI0007E5F06F|nr:uncharacterized protein LOC108162899 [Drosophila miranda]XP_033248467.1 uncharacterized protein LOC117188586 [Drosophila miranda]
MDFTWKDRWAVIACFYLCLTFVVGDGLYYDTTLCYGEPDFTGCDWRVIRWFFNPSTKTCFLSRVCSGGFWYFMSCAHNCIERGPKERLARIKEMNQKSTIVVPFNSFAWTTTVTWDPTVSIPKKN